MFLMAESEEYEKKEGIFMRDKRIIYFALLVIIVGGITLFNMYLNNRIDESESKRELKIQNELLKDENIVLKNELEETAPSTQEQSRSKLLSFAERFINLSFHNERNDYEDRRKEAEKMMNAEIFSYFYPTTEYELDEKYSSKPSDINLYLPSFNVEDEEVEIITDFINETHTHAENIEKTHNVIKLTVKKEGDSWRVIKLNEILLELI